MKKSLALLNIVLISSLILSGYMLYTGVAPIVQGKVRVEMQDIDDVKWSISNSTISADTYINISNGGYYDIKDIELEVWIYENESHYEIARFSDNIPVVKAGAIYKEPIHMSVNLDSIPSELKNRLINESAEFIVRGEISAHSVKGLGIIKVHYHNHIEWEPLVKKLEIRANETRISYSSSELLISVPYFVSTSSLLSGYADAVVEIYNGSERLSYDEERVPLGEDYNSSLRFHISSNDTYYLMTHSEILPIKMRVRTDSGFEFTRSSQYRWGAPFDGLFIGEVQRTLNSAYVDYSFVNNYSRDLDLSIDITAYDSGGNIVGQSHDHYTAFVGEEVHRTASVSVNAVPSYVIVKVTENISGWSYEMRRDVQ